MDIQIHMKFFCHHSSYNEKIILPLHKNEGKETLYANVIDSRPILP